MRPSWRAALWLGATMLAGVALGMLLNGALAARRERAMRDVRGARGFVAEMEQLIRPRDEAQRARLRPLLEATDRANRAIIDGARASMAAVLDSLRRAVDPMLDAEQRQRLAEFGGPPETRGPGDDGRGRGAPPGLGPDGPPRGGRPPRRH